MADDIPSMEELVEVGARAAWADPGSYGDERTDWDELVGLIGEEGKAAQDTFRSQARAILSAVLPLVLVPAGKALGKMCAMIDDGMVSEGYVFEDGEPYEPEESDLELVPDGSYRLSDARAIRDRLRALAETAIPSPDRTERNDG